MLKTVEWKISNNPIEYDIAISKMNKRGGPNKGVEGGKSFKN